MIGRTNTGGGGVGGVLTVTAPAGVTVSVSKDGKVKTKTSNAEGLAVFKGLETGTWTLTITNGVQTSTKPVVITADYNTVIAFFSATINITYPAGSTCTCSDGSTIFTAPDTSGTWACIVPNAGTWTVSCTDGSNSKSEDVSITADGQSTSVSLHYVLYLYNNGTFADADGGLKQVGVTYDGRQPGECVITANESYVTIGSMVGLTALAYFPKKYDLNDFKTLYFNGSFVNNDPEYLGKYSIGVWKTIPTGDARVEASAIMDGKMEKDTYALDVSSCTGEHYVGIVIFGYGPASNPASVVTMHQMYLE